MDRNFFSGLSFGCLKFVATREGGVDRNKTQPPIKAIRLVATREGGVDRNGEDNIVDEIPSNGRHPRGWRG